MRKIYTLVIGVVASVTSFAQTTLETEIVSFTNKETVLPVKGTEVSSLRGTTNCIDTVDYALYRSLNSSNQFTWANITLEDSASSLKGMGLFFPKEGTQNYTMSGFEFQAVGLRADGMPSQTIVSVYAAGADSLPMGTPLTTQTISVDTSSARGFFDGYIAHTFTPINVSTPIVVTIEAGSPVDSIVIWTGGVLSGVIDGYPTSLEINGNWVRPKNLTQLGEVIPRFHPIISYNATNTLVSSVVKLSGPNESVVFTSTYPEIGRSVLAFSGLLTDDNTAFIDFGDGSSKANPSISESHAYAVETQDYEVTLTDSIRLYQANVGVCVVTEKITIQKAYPLGINDLDSGKFFAFTSNDEIVVGNGEGTAVLYSITGTVVKQVVLSSTLERINVSDLSNGVYMLQVGENVVKLNL